MDSSANPGVEPAATMTQSVAKLAKRLNTHDEGLKMLQAKFAELLVLSEKLRSDLAKVAIHELGTIVKKLKESRE